MENSFVQAVHAKTLIADINNRNLDNNTKDEVRTRLNIIHIVILLYIIIRIAKFFLLLLYLIYIKLYVQLQLFYTQISSRSTEFTACDLFTLNTRLITSVSINIHTFTVMTKNTLILINIHKCINK